MPRPPSPAIPNPHRVQDLASYMYDTPARPTNGGTRRYDAADSMPVACDMLLVTSWEETSGDERQSLDEADCIAEFLPGGGVSPSAISQGFATVRSAQGARREPGARPVADGQLWADCQGGKAHTVSEELAMG
jgi:hypothetical protein